MAGETINSDTYNTPAMSKYDEQDAKHYSEGLKEEGVQAEPDYEFFGSEKEEARYDGSKIPEERLKENAAKIEQFHYKHKKMGNSVLRFASSFGKAA